MAKTRRDYRLAYFQGADNASVEGNVTSNDPAKLGYGSKEGVHYKLNELETSGGPVRNQEQKAFEGAANETKKNFGPSGEEFDLKKHWLRIPEDAKIANAKLSAKFSRKAEAKDSFWTIFATDKSGVKQPVLKASLVEIWGNKLPTKVANYLELPQLADKEIWNDPKSAEALVSKTSAEKYIKEVFAEIRKKGFSVVGFEMTGNNGFLKRAKENGKTIVAQMYGDESLEMLADGENSPELPGEAPHEDLGEALDGEVETTAGEADITVDLLEQKHDELEAAQLNLVEKTAPETTAEVFIALQDAEEMVGEAKEEMALASKSLRDKTINAATKIKMIKLVAEATEEAINTLTSSDDVISKAEEAIAKADEAIAKSEEVAGGGEPVASEGEIEEHVESPEGDIEIDKSVKPLDGEAEMINIEAALNGSKAKAFVSKFLKSRADYRKSAAVGEDKSYEQGKYGVKPEGGTKDGNDEIERAHVGGGTTIPGVEVGGKPSDNGARFDTKIEQQEHDLKVADKMPTGELSGKSIAVASKKLAELIKSAEADSATKEFWTKLLWGQSDAKGKEFGKELVQDYDKAVRAASEEAKAKVVRAYELADNAIEKGFCDRTAEAKSKFVKEIVAFNDEDFVSFKNIVEAAPSKVESRVAVASLAGKKIPNVGLKDDSGIVEQDLTAKLSSLNWK